MKLLEYIARGAAGEAEIMVNPTQEERRVAAGGVLSLVVVHSAAEPSTLEIELGEGAVLHLVEAFSGGAMGSCRVRQGASSRCEITSVVTGSAEADYAVDMDGSGAENNLRGAFIAGGAERVRFGLRVSHNVGLCTSNSLVKGVAGGSASCEFNGLVYVAQDAQNTDARQTSRNIVLGDEARIVAKPQLEIYADDVKCSHGATVGQLDDDAILYMRQRGLSEAQARRLQIEGFVRDIVSQAGSMGEALAEVLTEKLEEL